MLGLMVCMGLQAQISLEVRVPNDDFRVCPQQAVALKAFATYTDTGYDLNPTTSTYQWRYTDGHTEGGLGHWLTTERRYAAGQRVGFECIIDDGAGHTQTFVGELLVAAEPQITLRCPENSLCLTDKINLEATIEPAQANGHTHSYTNLVWTGAGVPLNSGGSVRFAPVRNQGTQTYTLRAQDDYGCIHTQSLDVDGVTAELQLDAATERQAQHRLVVSNQCEQATQVSWFLLDSREAVLDSVVGPDAMAPQVEFQIERPGVYGLLVRARNGQCSQERKLAGPDDWITIVDSSMPDDLPNMFSPNGDGRNERFVFDAPKSMRSYEVLIWNRWGRKVHHIRLDNMQNPQENWLETEVAWDGTLDNGSEASPGTYYYIVLATGYDNRNYQFKGSLELVRD